ncbi:Oxysterol-binding protein-domain-containing protein [Kockovaella imperatae]|uniref:Oxysterol-binding protein-domain-containing protein n=1 Tax=Kockovaella imperatae TaxID=4999 RepID=A0A1Y1URL8_9TREE|nr:Oxysterol-binding protein-domain-containing protein [Kockovaella imperatae]ORX40701.1 Oxysterol-binding protein-domain-containing protein [Kockovaella imperatae]
MASATSRAMPTSQSRPRLSKSDSTVSFQSNASTPSAALYNFKLLEALRSDDPKMVQPFIDELKPSPTSAAGQADVLRAGNLLGMAVRVSSMPIVNLIISSPSITSPNLPVSSASLATSLHVASEIGRIEAVQLLLNHPKINDTIRDDQGRTPLECAANAEVAALIEESRTNLQLQYLGHLGDYVSSPLNSVEESLAMVDFLEGSRVEILNLNALDEKSGTSLLHEAAHRRDLRLVELALKRGADVFVRDRKGRRVLEGEKGADERIKVFLKQFNNQDNLVQNKSDGRPPDLKGFLSKWVNYRSGWRTRWFVLENGVLSYYRNREDETVACRGSIAMATAKIHPSTDGSRFEVGSRVSSSVPKMIVKSAHRAEIARWIQAIKLNVEYYSNQAESSGRGLDVKTSNRSLSSSSSQKPVGSAIQSLPPSDSFLSAKLARTTTGLSNLSVNPPAASSSMLSSINPVVETEDEESLSIYEAAEKDSIVESIRDQPHPPAHGIPHENTYDLGVLNIKAQVELTQQLVNSISITPPGSPIRGGAPLVRTNSRQQAVKEALRASLETLATQVSVQTIMAQDRERYLLGRIQRELEARKVWEENMLAVAQQQADTDRQLNEAAKDNEKKRRALRKARGVLAGLSNADSLPTSPALESATTPLSGILDKATTPSTSTDYRSLASPPLLDQSISNMREINDAHDEIIAAAGAESDSDEEEFFDAVEANTIPNLQLHESIANPAMQRAAEDKAATGGNSKNTIVAYLGRKSLEPYGHLRSRLPIDDDKRPSVSLWSILKSSVGKDLTKISFPVSFNECTSMLQRMTEDMEYDACLTVAAEQEDSLKRIAFVGAFAMSNYSSTIGRIAKPFNPLLSQTFEYALPNRYRYVSEQVSHHPPISTCYCEAPRWKYYGEVDTQNKFQGRSFEIRPTGVVHVELIIPLSWVKGVDYPAAGPEYGSEFVVEHYSWRKVTTNISGFITGSPVIDHYGDLIVTNHRTGETCTLTFKPRGWRGSNAFEIKGDVVTAEGQTAWDIAGRWDSQLVARKSGTGSAPLDADAKFAPSQKEYLLLWRKTESPKSPFNLTQFAISLNDIPEGLEPYLCPTDCRLRTDQRAFENAEYDLAQELKTANEDKQRMTRKLRAEGKVPPHEPRWFEPATEADTNERVWLPKRAEDGEVKFWAEREKKDWSDVEHIFVEADSN